MTDEELLKLLDDGIICRDDIFTFAEKIARELLEARTTIREMAMQALSDADRIQDMVDEVERLRAEVAEYKNVLSRD